MFMMNFILFLRGLRRRRVYSLIHISGLSIGMACVLLIFLFVRHEMSFDRYHEYADRIFRITMESQEQDRTSHTTLTPNPLAPELLAVFPEIQSAVRINDVHQKVKIQYNDRTYLEDGFILADPSIFDIFSFSLMRGDAARVLESPFSVVISETAAEKYFGDEDPVGKSLNCENRFDFEVTGVMEDIPENSHFRCDFIAPFSCADEVYWRGYSADRTQSSVRTYVHLREDVDPKHVEEKLPEFVETFLASIIQNLGARIERIPGGAASLAFELHLQPLTSIHLHSHLSSELEPNYDIRYIILYSAVAVIVLLVACINYINLSTALSSTRAREIGLRKSIGGRRKQLVGQFMVEALTVSFAALALASVWSALFLPVFNTFIGAQISLRALLDPQVFIGLLLFAMLVGAASGSYPALYVSAFRPMDVMSGRVKLLSKRPLHAALVVFQFTISLVLIAASLTVSRQCDYIAEKKLGFDKEHVVVLPMERRDVLRRYAAFKHELLKHSDIQGVTGSSNVLSRVYSSTPIWWEGAREGESFRIQKLFVDTDFIDFFDIELIDGRGLSEGFSALTPGDFILNRSAAARFGWEDPIGKRLAWAYSMEEQGEVIGVIKDFHFRSLHETLEPLVLLPGGGAFRTMYVKLASGRISETLAWIEGAWGRFFHGQPFEFFFLDEDIERMYDSEIKLGRLFRLFSFLAVAIACLGLFGLTAYTTMRRSKEIGIRKVLGASSRDIFAHLCKDTVKMVSVASLFAWPAAYYVLSQWLRQFAYRIDLGFGIFAMSAFLVLGIAIFAVGYESYKAATADPVDAIRYE